MTNRKQPRFFKRKGKKGMPKVVAKKKDEPKSAAPNTQQGTVVDRIQEKVVNTAPDNRFATTSGANSTSAHQSQIKSPGGKPPDTQDLTKVEVIIHKTDVNEDLDVVKSGSKETALPSSPEQRPSLDLVGAVKGMYRILDLVSEPGTGGLVDKIIIAQESFGRFANDVCPNAYQSMTNVKFTALDAFSLRPLGLYGSKPEIVRYLQDLTVVDEETAHLLLESKTDASGAMRPALRSGLYFLRDPEQESLVYVIYWPEDTTWDDNAVSSVRRNRVTFMRYLTKTADQIVALLSEKHANALVWNEEPVEDTTMDSEDESDRLFTFEVAKTKEQEENVTTRPGFKIQHSSITSPSIPEDSPLPNEHYVPRLVQGETCVGFVTTSYVSPSITDTRMSESFIPFRLREFIARASFCLSPSLSEAALTTLFKYGLDTRAPHEAVKALKDNRKSVEQKMQNVRTEQESQMGKNLEMLIPLVLSALSAEMAQVVTKKYRVLLAERLVMSNESAETSSDANSVDTLNNLAQMHPTFDKRRKELCNDAKLKSSTISTRAFTECRDRILALESQFDQHPEFDEFEQRRLLRSANEGTSNHPKTSTFANVVSLAASFVPSALFDSHHVTPVRTVKDSDFVNGLPALADKYPVLASMVEEAMNAAHNHFATHIHKEVHKVARHLEELQKDECRKQLAIQAAHETAVAQDTSRAVFLKAVQDAFVDDTKERMITVDDLQPKQNSHHYNYQSEQYQLTGFEQMRNQAAVEHIVRVLQLTEGDKHDAQLDSSFVPTPRVFDHPSFTFRLPLSHIILHLQLLQSDRCLLVVDHVDGDFLVFLERIHDLSAAITAGRFKKCLRKEKSGNQVLLAYNETKRMLAVCGVEKLSLHIFVFDEQHATLQGFGSSVELRPWYDAQSKLCFMVFRGGSHEELALLDHTGRIRIYSLATQQFRPATFQLHTMPKSVLSSPDGACFFCIERNEDSVVVQANHWSSFGSSAGISLELDNFPADSFTLTSFINRSKCHIVGMSIDTHTLQSSAVDITHKVTEFSFKADGRNRNMNAGATNTAHNSLIDCYSDVWTRFPVIPAVQRHTVGSADRLPRVLLFVSHLDSDGSFKRYFARLITTFESATRKPVEDVLDRIVVLEATYRAFLKQREQTISSFKAGEWLVDILCLIPIHLAVARDNRFVPLKDGIWSSEQERSLLGATVDQVIDGLSFGWYESIFQSYMASKPVRVVTSMGEQSVGKSFALNHLVDTSFAGSAMRTTEGVWMSVTPTTKALIVALDFEGVHSIERSAQEDSLLVLFNTALSNLVLFRNNFALSRDITGLFQSFQSSSTVLDPASNPSLFKSTLVIIIKDVVDSDKTEITKEFSLKFQRIVEIEQESNFITRLHAGKLAIIPWPVIESRQFYSLFPRLKRMLDKQPISHPKAGVFLQTMKTLMAKLKTNDWGSLDQNLASHRAQQLLGTLPIALSTGGSELEPDFEPLKDLDNGSPIDAPDSNAHFFISAKAESDQQLQEQRLAVLQADWDQYDSRFHCPDPLWTDGLGSYLERLADMRVYHVRKWLDVNMERFKADAPEFDTIRRSFESMVVGLKASIQLCKLQCADCQLLCLHARHHDGAHNCRTDHQCAYECEFQDEHGGIDESCGLPAGHSGAHICDISAHLCGQPCRLAGKGGCLERCGKIVNHIDEDHLCPAQSHECGMPCSLSGVRLPDQSLYTCQETCHISSEQDHAEHVCKKQSCPLACQLCKRLCASSNHLHALELGAVHLCGQEHTCSAVCQSPGICRIETAPQSMEATFTGRHETFQYTKYTQVSKRLPCVIPVPPGETTHPGKHSHNQDPKAFHFCETRCEYCGYFCTLPLGHTQQEHETSHGSMSRTRWAVDGPEGTALEVNGHRFGSNDDGAPMLCSMLCRTLGRHAHIDYCRSENPQSCRGADLQHIASPMVPEANRPKDFIAHDLYWRRTGFKDPYSQEDRVNFSKCDAMCGGPEHQGDANGPATPSYCNLPIFHAALAAGQAPPGGIGYVSGDGHHFSCRNPAQMQQAFHVIFVIDRSGSMGYDDRRPLRDTPVTARIAGRHDNRIGSVYSSLYAFWSARQTALGGTANRRDAYSVLLFHQGVVNSVSNDFTSTPEVLLDQVLRYGADGGTNYTAALQAAQVCMETHWSAERSPVVVFLSDGECEVQDSTVRDLCRRAVALGRPLSFHSVAFGPSNTILRRMAQIASGVERGVPVDPMHPLVASSYTEALDSVRLAETFLGIAESLRRPRGALMKV